MASRNAKRVGFTIGRNSFLVDVLASSLLTIAELNVGCEYHLWLRLASRVSVIFDNSRCSAREPRQSQLRGR